MELGKQSGRDSEQRVLLWQPEAVAGTAAALGNTAQNAAELRVRTLPNPTQVPKARGAPSELLTSPASVLWFKPGAE